MSHAHPSPMQQHLADYRAYLEGVKMRRPRTIESYCASAAEFAEFLPTGTAFECVDRATVLRFLASAARMESGTPSRATFNGHLAAIRSLFDFLVKTEVTTMNPTTSIDRLKIAARAPLPLSLDEMLALTAAMEASERGQGARNAAMALVFIHCGLRVAEVVGLKRNQVDLGARFLINVRTKGGKNLSVPLNDVVAEAIEAYVAERDVEPTEADELFLSNRLEALSVRAVQNLVTSAGKKAGIERKVSPHLLRHSSVTELVELGVSIRTVQEIVGHANVTTTERYAHLSGRDRREALDTLARAWVARKKERAA